MMPTVTYVTFIHYLLLPRASCRVIFCTFYEVSSHEFVTFM